MREEAEKEASDRYPNPTGSLEIAIKHHHFVLGWIAHEAKEEQQIKEQMRNAFVAGGDGYYYDGSIAEYVQRETFDQWYDRNKPPKQ